jgi:hypothetical protein
LHEINGRPEVEKPRPEVEKLAWALQQNNIYYIQQIMWPDSTFKKSVPHPLLFQPLVEFILPNDKIKNWLYDSP